MDKSSEAVLKSVVTAATSDPVIEKPQQLAQPPQYTDALIVRVYEEEEASYECCRTF